MADFRLAKQIGQPNYAVAGQDPNSLLDIVSIIAIIQSRIFYREGLSK